CQLAHVSVCKRDVLDWVRETVAYLYLVQNRRRKNAGLICRNDPFAAAEPLSQQIAEHARRSFRTAFSIVIVERARDRSPFLRTEVVIDAGQGEVVVRRNLRDSC